MVKLEESKKYSLNIVDLKNIGVGALIALGGALITYLLEILPKLDLGDYTPIVVALASILLNSVRKYLSGK